MLSQLSPIDVHDAEEIIEKVTISLSQCRQTISEFHLESDLNSNLKESIDSIKSSQQMIHYTINEYFKDLNDNFVLWHSNFQSEPSKKDILERIDQMLESLGELSKRAASKRLTPEDQKILDSLNQATSQMENHLASALSRQSNGTKDLPQIKVNHRVVEGLYLTLNEYASVLWPGDVGLEEYQNLSIEGQNNVSHLIVADELQSSYGLFNISTGESTVQKYNSQTKSNLEYDATVAYDGDTVYFVGGVNKTGFLSASFHMLSGNNLQKLPDMLVKRVGAAALITHVEGINYLYVFGGKTDNKFKTKLCERFNFKTSQWEKLAQMNYARAKAAVAQVDQEIYVFFGVDSENQNTSVVEKFHIKGNVWETLNIANRLPGFDVSDATAVGINQHLIMLFGGIRYSCYFPDQMYFNKKVIAFNVTNNTLAVLDHVLPLDMLPVGNPVIFNNAVYSVGRIMKQVDERPYLYLDGAFVLKIDKECARIIKYLSSQMPSQ